jgi:quercetin dioxygenase-like cupin family protein
MLRRTTAEQFSLNAMLSFVERLRFDAESAWTPPDERLENVTIAALTPPLRSGVPVQAAVFRLAPGGRIARHPATVSQILAVLEGEGHVSGADGAFVPIVAGEAAFWSAGEEHETLTDSGLTALVIEAEGLSPARVS